MATSLNGPKTKGEEEIDRGLKRRRGGWRKRKRGRDVSQGVGAGNNGQSGAVLLSNQNPVEQLQ